MECSSWDLRVGFLELNNRTAFGIYYTHLCRVFAGIIATNMCPSLLEMELWRSVALTGAILW